MQSDHDRRELYLALHDLLGPSPAGTLMELLPPVGWSDLVRQSDLTAGLAGVRGDMAEFRGEMSELRGGVAAEFAAVRGEIAELRGEVRGGFAEVRGELAEVRGELARMHARIDAQIPKFIWANVPIVASVAGLVLAAVKLA